ncbi:MAG: hypothetical protein QOF02_3096 [Blastocatellia bacterium]|jgi:uncharacterized protein YdhG (YjbR/CyaY superfamily)|nr:hypothetical protein [Blastocatellia bacterium]
MVKSAAATVEEYLSELPEERRAIVARVREVILQHLPEGYKEAMNWGMIAYEVPRERFPDTYNGQPLAYVALAAQKNYFALHLIGVYQDSKQETWLREAFAEAGKKLEMGKGCLRFRKLDDLPLEVIGRVVAAITPDELIEQHKANRSRGR